MGNQPWLDRVRERLARQALPSAYIRRFTEELSDHLEDLKEESMETDAHSRLGEPEQVAEAAVVAYRRRSFLGRHPVAAFLVFAISPVISLYVLFIVFLFLLAVFSGIRTVDWYRDHWMFSPIILVCSTFVGILYGELATWLGIGRKWTLATCAVVGTLAMLFELGFGVTLMVLLQIAVPLAVGWRFTRRKCNHGYPATTFLVFAISPVASYLLLMSVFALAIAAAQPLFFGSGMFANVHYVPVVVLASSLMLLMTLTLVPTVVPTLLYCKLVGRLGIGRKWMWVSCTVLAVYTAMQNIPAVGYVMEGHGPLLAGLAMCIILIQSLVPLAIGWWFMRRKHDQGQLGLAA